MNIQGMETTVCRAIADYDVNIGLRSDRVPDNG